MLLLLLLCCVVVVVVVVGVVVVFDLVLKTKTINDHIDKQHWFHTKPTNHKEKDTKNADLGYPSYVVVFCWVVLEETLHFKSVHHSP